MKTKFNPAVVGAFVIGGFALLIIALLSFGGVSFFSKPQQFVVYFDESIHGLDKGSPVKLRGVRIGRVSSLNIRYDAKNNKSVVAVVCEFNKDIVTDGDPGGGVFDVSSRAKLQTLVDRGLRAQLGVLGLATGLLFVELDFKDPKEYPATTLASDPRYVAVPYVPSAITEIQNSVTDILASIKRVDFPALSRELVALLAETRKRLEGVDFKGLVDQWKKTGTSVDTLATSTTPQLKETLANLNAAVTELRGTFAKLDTQVGTNGEQLTATLKQARETLESFNAAAAGARKFIAAQSGLGEEATRALSQLAEAASAVQRLADFLERNPQALISGKPLPK
jgi:paraquat-inducible protein B